MEDAEPKADVWPDNEAPVNVFIAASSQWRVGFGGPYALDYSVLPIVAAEEYRSPDWPEIFDCVRVMEEEALKTMAQKGRK